MKSRKLILKYFLFSFVFFILLTGVLKPLKIAQGMGSIPAGDFSALTSIKVGDKGNLWQSVLDTGKDVARWAEEIAIAEWEWIRDLGAAVAYRKALDYFLQQLAYDTATYLATGDKGQGSMFYTESWGDYLGNVADNAVGHFLEELGEGGPTKFDLCNPGLDVTMKIGLGIMESKNPNEPDCTFTEMKNNWEAELQRDDFLNRFGNMFEPQSNDFGIALSLQGKVMEKEVADKEVAALNRSVNDGFKDVTESISGFIKTPSDAVRNAMIDAQNKSGASHFTNTGFALADAIDVFTNTLISKLMEEWLKKGLARSQDNTSYTGDWGGFSSGSYSSGFSSGRSSYSGSGGLMSLNNSGALLSGSGPTDWGGSAGGGTGGLTAYNADTSVGSGINAAKEQFKNIIEPSFSIKGDYEVLGSIAGCGDPVNAKTNECVITESFRQAIENRMTVGDAMRRDYISKDGTFGFRADGLEPNFNEGFPYRSMMILRKYRIIPVGWELAAEYIMENQNSLGSSFNLYDMIACFSPTDNYEGYEGIVPGPPPIVRWCEGLVDPSWVLKAPQNFCKREGAGPYIISATVAGSDKDSKYMVARDESYCADEQTCIKENDDGSCELYGYCTEDRRKYNFNGESCEPVYNTCESFRASDGRTVALLENTLDYGDSVINCSVDNAGCRYFMQAIDRSEGGDGTIGNYNSEEDEVNWGSQSGSIHLDYSANECDMENEGCHEFIRTKAGLGSNLLTNPSFEEFVSGSFIGWTGPASRELDDVRDGFVAMRVGSGPIHRDITIDPLDIDPLPASSEEFRLGGNMFALSLYAKNCPAGATLMISDDRGTESASVDLETTDWKFIAVTHAFGTAVNSDTLNIDITGAIGCILDAAKLELTNASVDGLPTRFTGYRDIGLVYQKIIPDYLYESCYDYDRINDGLIVPAPNAPEICNDYSRYCTASEVNCELYQSLTSNFSVPATVVAENYCPAECVDYDLYRQTETSFEYGESESFIPATADTCSALSAGCDEFTNLDEVDDPEAREYFVNLRQCVNPDSVATCESFFVWEGADDTGYQLRVHQLDTAGGNIRTIGAGGVCSTMIGELDYDADCRDFYNEDGAIEPVLYYNTVSCTEDCHPYRRTVMNDLATERINCDNHGGEWQVAEGYCIHMGVPSEGITCQAEEAGCREYNGNAGANTRIIFEHSFEHGTNQGWDGGSPNNTSVIMGEHSLSIFSNASLTLGSELIEGRSYVLQFLATGANIVDIAFSNSVNSVNFNNSAIPANSSWVSYELSLSNLSHAVHSSDEALVINTGGEVFIDNIRLIEVLDRHYVIENSWVDSCEYIDADPGAGLWSDNGSSDDHYIGCDAYHDRDSNIHNLFEFNRLCSDSAVGCELMIDTHNRTAYDSEIRFDDNDNDVCDPGEPDCVFVEGDSYVYAVYNDNMTCNKQDKGCERMGIRYSYEYPNTGDYSQYFDNYKLNNPDLYVDSLCRGLAEGCDSWESREGNSYFKDPADMICEWRIEKEEGMGLWNWFKKEVKRCDVEDGSSGPANGEIDTAMFGLDEEPIDTEKRLCSDASDCALTVGGADWCESDDECVGSCVENKCRDACILDEHDYPCELDNDGAIVPKTIGHGGPGNKIVQPLGDLEDSDWVAICPAGQGACTEYIDPDSKFSFNVDTLKPHTLYILSRDSPSAFPATCSGPVYELDIGSNMLVNPASIVAGDIFYYASDDDCSFDADAHYIRKAVVDYQLEHSLDKTTCNGMVDLEQGCYLFNERKRDGVDDMVDLEWSANAENYNAPEAPVSPPISPFPADSNVILKVNPDRVCNTWLSCRSFIKDEEGNDVCYDVGFCERLDDNGNCSYFSNSSSDANQIHGSSGLDISNMTGYSKVAYDDHVLGDKLMTDYYPIGNMKQEGEIANVPNGSFELYDGNLYPLGWTPANNGGNIDWERDMFKVINNPISAQAEKIEYPLDGSTFLKFGARDEVQSEIIELAENTEYILTFYINTKNLARGRAYVDVMDGATSLVDFIMSN